MGTPKKPAKRIKPPAVEAEVPNLPFDEVVKRLLQAPPQHKIAKKKATKKK